jgi:hypothetical protein
MNKDFVPYQPSIDMKGLGFNEPCFGHYLKKQFYLKAYDKQSEGITLRPTYSQAFRFFREKYNLNVFIQNGTSSWMAFIGNTPTYIPFVDEVKGSNKFKGHNTYEEAELACLIKLIEIANEKTV